MLTVELRSLRSKDYLAYILVLLESLLVELSATLSAWVQSLMAENLFTLFKRNLFGNHLLDLFLFSCVESYWLALSDLVLCSLSLLCD